MEITILKFLPVFFGLCSTIGIIGLMTRPWCLRSRKMWVVTGLLCIFTAAACAVSRIVLGNPHAVISVTYFIIGSAMIRRSLRPFQHGRKQAAA